MDISSSDRELGAEKKHCRYDFITTDLNNIRVTFDDEKNMKVIYPYSRNERVDKGNGKKSTECVNGFALIMLEKL